VKRPTLPLSIGGFDELYALEQSGELDGLLQATS
jgi:hypothetical protein